MDKIMEFLPLASNVEVTNLGQQAAMFFLVYTYII